MAGALAAFSRFKPEDPTAAKRYRPHSWEMRDCLSFRHQHGIKFPERTPCRKMMINVHNISPGKSYVTIYSNQTGSKLCNEKKTSSVCWQNRSENRNCNCSQLTMSKLHDTVIDQGRIVWGCLIETTRVAKIWRWFCQILWPSICTSNVDSQTSWVCSDSATCLQKCGVEQRSFQPFHLDNGSILHNF